MAQPNLIVILSGQGKPNKGERSAIYSHIAKHGHQKRRRQQSAGQHGQVLRRPVASKVEKWLPSALSKDAPEARLRCTVHEPKWIKNCPQCQQAIQGAKVETSVWLAPYKGNSDPFDAQPILIDARANYYLDIGFNCFENVVWKSGFRAYCPPRGYVAPPTTTPDLDLGINLYGRNLAQVPTRIRQTWSSTYANAILAYSASAIFAVSGSQEHSSSASSYIDQCKAGYALCKASGPNDPSCRQEELLFRLLRAEILAQSFSNALAHVDDLKRSIIATAQAGRLDLNILHHISYQTNNFALLVWTRPMLKAPWLEEVYATDWAPLTVHRKDKPHFKHALKRFTDHADLQEMLTATKILFVQTSSCLAWQTIAPSDKWYWLDVRGQWLQICLVNFVHDQEARINEDLSESTIATICLDLCLAFTTILSIRFQQQEPILQDIAVSPISCNILRRLWAALTQLESCSTQKELLRVKDALLWIMFVAAVVEHRLRKSLLRNGQADRWWWQRLVEMIVSRGICTWTEMRHSLTLFPYSEDETPLPEPTWLDRPFEMARSVQRLF